MQCRSFIICALTALLSSVALPVTAKADTTCPAAGSGPNVPASSPFTDPSVPDFNSGALGPNPMPSGPVGKLIGGYNRFGVPPMTAKDFVHKYYNDSQDAGKWAWPTNFGFAGTPQPYTLKKGQLVDRFGSPYGQFLASEKGTPFAARAMPPSSLSSFGGTTEANYHVYCVLKELTIQSGKIAPAFAQPGGGIQYFLGNARVMDLIAGNDLVEVAP